MKQSDSGLCFWAPIIAVTTLLGCIFTSFIDPQPFTYVVVIGVVLAIFAAFWLVDQLFEDFFC